MMPLLELVGSDGAVAFTQIEFVIVKLGWMMVTITSKVVVLAH
jgi:hypothetical protein